MGGNISLCGERTRTHFPLFVRKWRKKCALGRKRVCPGFVRFKMMWKPLFWYFRLLLALLLVLRLSALSAATSSLNDMGARAPATITVAKGGVQYATT